MATRYLSTRGGSYDCSFESVVLKGLADDGGLFLPEQIPHMPENWSDEWLSWDFRKLAFEIFSLYISPSEIPPQDLRELVDKSYSPAVFRSPQVTPLVRLDSEEQLYLLELFHGPTFAFKDVALQFLGNLFEYFLVRRNKGRETEDREHLTVLGATSGDTGSAAIYGLKGKSDVSILILHPHKRISPIQEAQMTSVLDENVYNFALKADQGEQGASFDDCQDLVKAAFGDADINHTHKLAAVNSINWARILAQISYYFSAYASLRKPGRLETSRVRFVVPTGNFGDVLAGYFAKRMGLPIEKLVIATNSNDILNRFWKSGSYEKQPTHGEQANGGFPEDGVKAHEDGVKETLSPAMDILVSSNFERLLWFLAYGILGTASEVQKRKTAGEKVKCWLDDLKSQGGFSVPPSVLEAARADFESERVSDDQTLAMIATTYAQESPAATSDASKGTTGVTHKGKYILDPHSAVGVHVARKSLHGAPEIAHIALATAHPAKFSAAVQEALKGEDDFEFDNLLPEQFVGLEALERRLSILDKSKGIEGFKKEIRSKVPGSK